MSILSASISTQVTSLPLSAKHVPVTRPTYPVPMTAIFMAFASICGGVVYDSIAPLPGRAAERGFRDELGSIVSLGKAAQP